MRQRYSLSMEAAAASLELHVAAMAVLPSSQRSQGTHLHERRCAADGRLMPLMPLGRMQPGMQQRLCREKQHSQAPW